VEDIIAVRSEPEIVHEEIAKEESAQIVQNDILEFIPDVKSVSGLLFAEKANPKPEKKSLNDLLTGKKEEQTLGVRFQQSFIPDLTKAIAINEKFTFIRELFHNSGVNFSAAIHKLNECKNIEEAFMLMEEFKHQYLWNTTSSSYLTLCDLVRRRFL
jgi:aminoglycoside phosphotransferase (APT) family kinase protein